jgi:hypothetical protein
VLALYYHPKETVSSAGSRGIPGVLPVGVGAFSGFPSRSRHRHHQKILVRNLDAPNFWFGMMAINVSNPPASAQAIRDNDQEVGRKSHRISRFLVRRFQSEGGRQGRPEVVLRTSPPEGVTDSDVKPLKVSPALKFGKS